jgi:la-related protein 4
MDSDQYVYISTVANFNMIKKLSSDLDLITDVLRSEPALQILTDSASILKGEVRGQS